MPGSVQEAVRELIGRNRSVHDCMRMDVVNYTALAARLQPEVERRLGGPVNLNTVAVAVKRYADSLGGGGAGGGALLKDARLSLTDGMVRVVLGADELGLLERVAGGGDYDLVKVRDSFSLLTGDPDLARELAGELGGGAPVSNGLVRIRIAVPDGARDDVGALVVDLLHSNGVGFVDARLGRGAMDMVFDRADAARAYDVLRAAMG